MIMQFECLNFVSFWVRKVHYFLLQYIVRYKAGQRFGRHIDESVDLEDGKSTHYTLLIYLSGGFKPKAKNDVSTPQDSSSEPLVGGETVFYGSRNSVVAEVASFLVIPYWFRSLYTFTIYLQLCYDV